MAGRNVNVYFGEPVRGGIQDGDLDPSWRLKKNAVPECSVKMEMEDPEELSFHQVTLPEGGDTSVAESFETDPLAVTSEDMKPCIVGIKQEKDFGTSQGLKGNTRTECFVKMETEVQFYRNGIYVCAGALIDKYHAITIAHKFLSVDKRNITVVGGVLYKYDYDTPHSFVRECSKLYVHNNYTFDGKACYNDLAICRLSGGLRRYTKFVQPIALNRNTPKEEKCIVSGWGRVTRRKRMYDPLEGDGGDPLVCNGKLTGLACYHFGCRRDRHRIFYMAIHYHIPWIDNILRISSG